MQPSTHAVVLSTIIFAGVIEGAYGVNPFCPYFKHAPLVHGIEDRVLNMTEAWHAGLSVAVCK